MPLKPLKKIIPESSKSTSKKLRTKVLPKRKKQLSFVTPSYESYWPGGFDYLTWARARETATLAEVEETSHTERKVEGIIVCVEHVIKPKKKTVADKLKARLTSVGI